MSTENRSEAELLLDALYEAGIIDDTQRRRALTALKRLIAEQASETPWT